jgi:hypothetical protein
MEIVPNVQLVVPPHGINKKPKDKQYGYMHAKYVC